MYYFGLQPSDDGTVFDLAVKGLKQLTTATVSTLLYSMMIIITPAQSHRNLHISVTGWTLDSTATSLQKQFNACPDCKTSDTYTTQKPWRNQLAKVHQENHH